MPNQLSAEARTLTEHKPLRSCSSTMTGSKYSSVSSSLSSSWNQAKRLFQVLPQRRQGTVRSSWTRENLNPMRCRPSRMRHGRSLQCFWSPRYRSAFCCHPGCKCHGSRRRCRTAYCPQQVAHHPVSARLFCGRGGQEAVRLLISVLAVIVVCVDNCKGLMENLFTRQQRLPRAPGLYSAVRRASRS